MENKQINEYAAEAVFKRVQDFARYMDEYTEALMIIAVSKKDHDGKYSCCIRLPEDLDSRAMVIQTFMMHPEIQPIIGMYIENLVQRKSDEQAVDDLINKVFNGNGDNMV